MTAPTTSTAVVTPRFESLDLLRFAAALSVTLYHLGFRGWINEASGYLPFPWLASIFRYGYLGVDAFFVISGFVILMTVQNHGPREFVASRIVRLYPAYWFCVIAAFVCFYLFDGKTSPQHWLTGVVNMSMLQEFVGVEHVDGVYWTLAIELRFYLLVLLLSLLRRIHRIELFMWAWMVLLVLQDRRFVALPDWLDAALIQAWAHYFVAGALFFMVRRGGWNWSRSLLLLLCLARALQHGYWYMLLKERLTGVPFDMVAVAVVLVGVFTLFAALSSGRLGSGRLAWASTLGALTYPLYLVHEIVGHALLFPRLSPKWAEVQLATVLLVALACAWGIHRWVERPWARWLKALLSPQQDSPAMSAKS